MNKPSAPLAEKRLVILDFDGTLVESVDIKTEAFREMFRDHPKAAEIVAYHLENNGVSRFVKLKHIYENFLGKAFDEPARAQAGERFSEIVFRRVVDCPFVPGADWFLQTLSLHRSLYLVSATPHEELLRILAARELSRYFRGTYGTPPGTKAGHIQAILATERCDKRAAVYIGDSREDHRAAAQAGIAFIGRRNKEDLGSHAVQFGDLKEIGEHLLSSDAVKIR